VQTEDKETRQEPETDEIGRQMERAETVERENDSLVSAISVCRIGLLSEYVHGFYRPTLC